MLDKSLTNSQILEFMRSVSIMSTSSISAEGPVNSILLFAVDEDFTMYFSTHSDSRKAKAFLNNPNIALSIWKYNEMLIQADGVVNLVEDQKDINAAFDKLSMAVENIKDFWPPVIHIEGERYSIYKIKLTRMSVLPLKKLTIHDYHNPFLSIPLP